MKSCTKENMQNMKTYMNLLYIFMTDWADSTSVTSADTAVLTSAVATSSFSQKSVNCINSLILKQLIVAMSVNQHLKQCFFDSLRFREKRVKFRS